jgi:4'-phosphopantetheinyl transferase
MTERAPDAAAASAWHPAPATLALSANAIHVWRTRLDPPAQIVATLAATLSADERERAARFHFELHRRRYIVGRGVLRDLLGRYLRLAPASLRFSYGEHGKPALAGPMPSDALFFNLSHSADLALYAFGIGRDIGVDVEEMRADRTTDEIARRFFSPSEVEALDAHSPAERVPAFFRCWTRKEAYIKGRSQGLSIPLDDFEVSIGANEPVRLIASRERPQDVARWRLASLDAGAGFAAALAVEGESFALKLFEWST